MKNRIYQADNLKILKKIPGGSVDLIYIDPPFNSGKVRKLTHLKTTKDLKGDRTGFGGKRYSTKEGNTLTFSDKFASEVGYMKFIQSRLEEAERILKPTGSLFVHLDYREVHYVKILLDTIFGRECFKNEIIWSYDFGGRSKSRWAPKHDNILWYVKDPKHYTFHYDAIERIPYMAPSLVGAEKAARGKTLTDSWWCTIVPTNGKERTGYPTQKPVRILRWIVQVHSNPGDVCLDFFAGSGSFGEAAGMFGRKFILVDNNAAAIKIAKKRLKKFKPVISSL